jgi:hypothetical protein
MDPIPKPSTLANGIAPAPALAIAGLCTALAVLLPLVVAWMVLLPWPGALLQALAQTGSSSQVNVAAQSSNGFKLAAVAALTLVPVLLMAAALLRAAKCLRAFARGEHFSLKAVLHLRAFAALVFVSGLASTLAPTFAILLLTVSGSRSLVLSLGSQHLLLLLFSAVTWQIASVLARAVALAEDHAQIV